jgi:hypothetical protein
MAERGCRSASRPVLRVTFNGTRADAGTMMVSAPGQNRRARMKNQRVQRIGGDGHHLPAANSGRGPFDRFRFRPFRVHFHKGQLP